MDANFLLRIVGLRLRSYAFRKTIHVQQQMKLSEVGFSASENNISRGFWEIGTEVSLLLRESPVKVSKVVIN